MSLVCKGGGKIFASPAIHVIGRLASQGSSAQVSSYLGLKCDDGLPGVLEGRLMRKVLKGQGAVLRFFGASKAVQRLFRLNGVQYLLAEH